MQMVFLATAASGPQPTRHLLYNVSVVRRGRAETGLGFEAEVSRPLTPGLAGFGMLCGAKAGGGGEDGLVTAVEGWAEEKDGGNAADHLREVCGFFGLERATQQGQLAVAEPFFQHLVAAESVLPDFDGDGGPEG